MESVQAGGRAHDYVVMVPREPTAAKLPIVFVYHGDGGSSDSLQRSWQVERAAGQSAVVVYPNSPGGWNVPEQSQANVFIAGFDAIRAKVAQEHGGDEGDVSALGWSNGGFFTQILGCWRGASLHTIGAMAGSYPYDKQSTGGEWPNEFPKCEGQTPVPALIMHGANDGVGNGKLSAVYWTYVNRCSANPDGCAVTDNTTPTARPPCVRFNDAPATDPVELCEIPGMGHQIWDQSAAAMWDFIQAAPK